MSNFDNYLVHIDTQINIDSNVDNIFRKDFDILRNLLLNRMCQEDDIFASIFNSSILFGSYANNIRINCPDEFDVLIDLRFPFLEEIQHYDDDENPGYIHMDFSDVCSRMIHHFDEDENEYFNFDADIMNFVFDRLTMNEMQYLDRCKLKSWLHKIFVKALQTMNKQFYGYNNDFYTLEYTWRGITHTVYAKSAVRYFSIDFVPAVKFQMHHNGNGNDGWYGVPKNVNVPSDNGKYTFLMCNAQAERQLLNKGGKKVKQVLRLLQSMRNAKNLPKLRCYFLVTVCLWEIRDLNSNFWQKSLGEIFIHLLYKLAQYFADGFLPFYWHSDMNLLCNFSYEDMQEYDQMLTSAFNTLKAYKNKHNFSYARFISHFEF